MENRHAVNAKVFKAFCDEKRLHIIEQLQTGEKCACVLLEDLNISQPTLSHHMKILCDCGLVNSRKEGKWMYYSLNIKNVQDLGEFLNSVIENNSKEEVGA